MRDSVSSGYPNAKKGVENRTCSSIFCEIQGVKIADETLSLVFNRSSQIETKTKE